jgi:hypothetical protein
MLVLGASVSAAKAGEPVAIVGPFIMSQSEDGQPSSDSFEVWDLLCNLKPPSPGTQPTCSLNAVSFVEAEGVTRLYTWRHDASRVSQVALGVYRAEFNGRLASCSGLDVIIRTDLSLPTGVESIEGDMRSGTRCESRRAFKLDSRRARAVAPLHNAAGRR